MSTVQLISFPPRPLDAGPLPLAAKKFGRHLYSPKYNGWRAIVHCPSGTMYNRHGQRLTIQAEFAEVLKSLQLCQYQWLDVEALERRHAIGKGSLMVIDAPIPGTAEQRFDDLSKEFPIHNCPEKPPENSLLLIPQMELDAASALGLWQDLQDFNKDFGCEFYEGIVTKRVESRYPIQTRDPNRSDPAWTKSRWRW